MNKKTNVLFIAFVASLGGLLFGYDTAVISGAISYLQIFYDLSPTMVGWAVSSALVGCIAGSLIAARLNETYGRKKVMILGAVCFGVSAYFSAVPFNFFMFVVARIIGGVGVGLATSLVPLYISEIAPAKIRGFLGSFFQIAVASGMCIVYFVNYKIAGLSTAQWNIEQGWRWMFGSECLPAIAFLILLFFIPESPRWLVSKGREEEALAVLERLNDSDEVEKEFNSIKKSLSNEAGGNKAVNAITPGAKKVVIICVLMSFFQQVSGINVILYYTPVVMKTISMGGENSAYFQSVLIGVIAVVGAVFTSLTADKFGRKNLLLTGTLFMTIFMLLMGRDIYTQNITKVSTVYIMGYVLAFCYSAGPVMWLYIAEVLPNSVRAKGMALASLVNWLSNMLVSQTFPILNDSPSLQSSFNGAFPFIVYGIFCIGFLVFTLKIPETKGKTLEELEAALA